jgi:hypothetical protein
MIDYLKVGKASELQDNDRKIYRLLEILPGTLSWATLLLLIIFSYFYPVFVAYFLIAFDVYWLLLVFYLGIHLISSYRKTMRNVKKDWQTMLSNLPSQTLKRKNLEGKIKEINIHWEEVINLVVFPIAFESYEVMEQSIRAISDCPYPKDKMIILMTIEERGGEKVLEAAKRVKKEYQNKFKEVFLTVHPDGIEGEIKGKGSNQAWAAKQIKNELIDKEKLDYDKILVSVFDIDTIIYPLYFHCLTYKFLTTPDPYRTSYQPVPVYHNNVWQASFFARLAAASNTFWQMMQQIRQEKLATYSSHSMTWRSLVEIGFWSKTMVSEDSRIFWHCFCFYDGDYKVEPMYYKVSMDITMDETMLQTAKNLYKQQRRWGWGVENIPYLIFNVMKRWDTIDKKKAVGRIMVQIYGFHSWATNALVIALIGWMPLLLGGDTFNSTVLSTNLPFVTRTLMTLAMTGLFVSAILSTILLPKRPPQYGFLKTLSMLLQWLLLPISIIIFGAIPALESQTRLMFGKYMGFFVTPKVR